MQIVPSENSLKIPSKIMTINDFSQNASNRDLSNPKVEKTQKVDNQNTITSINNEGENDKHV